VRELPTPNAASPDSVRAMSTELRFDYLAVRLNGSKAGDRAMTLGLTLPTSVSPGR
jgi:alkyl sulfatase BDS1-like metallo-beta-lactamase superfamily hydrolase